MVLLCVFILGKAFYIQRFQGEHWRNMSDSMHQRIVELDADRGTIYSEDGQMLSTSLPEFDIYLDFQADGLRDKNGKVFRENVDSFAIAMAKYFGDKTKRPIMGEAACEHSDRVIFTSDNPRSEDPAQIIRDMEEGLPAAAKRKYISIVDRREAIKTAISLAKQDDIILIAGKGHEKYQDIKGIKNHFDDKEVVKEVFEMLDK